MTKKIIPQKIGKYCHNNFQQNLFHGLTVKIRIIKKTIISSGSR